MPKDKKRNLSVFWSPSTPMIIGIVAVLVVQIASMATIAGLLDVTQSNVRVFSLVSSAIVTVFFIVMLIYRHSEARRAYLEGYIPDYPDEIDYVGAWTGSVLFLSLSIVLALLHWRNTAANAFDPLINAGPYARLCIVVGGYYLGSLIWLIVGVLIQFTTKGAEERRRFVDAD